MGGCVLKAIEAFGEIPRNWYLTHLHFRIMLVGNEDLQKITWMNSSHCII